MNQIKDKISDVYFIQDKILSKQIYFKHLLYINDVLIQSYRTFVSDECVQCQRCEMMFFSKCCCISEHFNVYCFVHNNNILIETVMT
jgi:hypothetical protein